MDLIKDSIGPVRLVLSEKNGSIIDTDRINHTFGIVAYNRKLNQWLLVQPKFSHGFKTILVTDYLTLMFTKIVPSLTIAERDILLELIELANTDTEHFKQRYVQYFHVNLAPYCLTRFRRQGAYLRHTLLQCQHYSKDIAWSFPRGQSHGNEGYLETARREFQEETEIDVKYLKLLHPKPLIDNHHGPNDCYYNNRYWIYEVTTTDLLEVEAEHPEIQARCWFDYEQALQHLNSHQLRILMQARKRVR